MAKFLCDIARGRKVVVCDHDTQTLDIFCRHLTKLGIFTDDLICVETLSETIAVAKRVKPDIIFIDLNCPGDGDNLLSLVRLANDELITPVVFMAFPENGIGPLRSLAVRGRGFMSKPVQLLPLKNKLEKLFREVDLERMIVFSDMKVELHPNCKGGISCQVMA